MKHKKKFLAASLAALLLVSTAMQFTAFGEELNFTYDTQETTETQVNAGNTTTSDNGEAGTAAESEDEKNNNESSGNIPGDAEENQPVDSAGTDNADGTGTGDSTGSTGESQTPDTSEEPNTQDEPTQAETLEHPAGLKADSIRWNEDSAIFAWKWKDENQQIEGMNRPDNLLGTVTWTGDDSAPVSEPVIKDAYMEIAVFVKNDKGEYGYISGDQLLFSTEEKHMNLWQFWHYVGGYSWEFIQKHESELIKASSTKKENGDVEVVFGIDSLITNCTTLKDEQYSVSYGLEPVNKVTGYSVAHPSDGADADQTLVAEPEQTPDQETGENPGEEQDPAEEEQNQPVEDVVENAITNLEELKEMIAEAAAAGTQLTEEQIEKLIRSIEAKIEALPAAGAVTAEMPDETFNALKADLQFIKESLATLEAQQPSWELEEGKAEKYETVLKAYDNVRLKQIEDRIKAIEDMEASDKEAQKDALRTELTNLVNEVAEIWADFNSDTTEDEAKQEEINKIRQALIKLLKELSNWIDKPGALDDVKLNETPIVLIWQWNDHNIQQAGAARPTTPLFGSETVWIDGIPYGKDAYVRLVVKVSGNNGETRSMNLWQFLIDECGYKPEYVKNNFPVFASADSRLLVSNGHGSDLRTTWNKDRLITAYTKNGEHYAVSYGLEYIVDREIPGYQIERVNEQTLRATPVEDFNATVVWYDNHNHYLGNNKDGVSVYTRPTESEYLQDLTLVRIYTDKNGTEKKDFFSAKDILEISPGTAPNNAAEAWSLSISALPKYRDGGEEYTYYLQQGEAGHNGKLFTGIVTDDKEAYYDPTITNDNLIEDDHPELIMNGGTVTNTLSREGKVKIEKVWKDGDNTVGDRPDTTLYYYRVAETDVIVHKSDTEHDFLGFNGSPVPGNDSRTEIQMLANGTKKVSITLPAGEDYLPMFDNYGRRYIYYAIEQMVNPGDYVSEVNNNDAGPVLLPKTELDIVRENAVTEAHSYILNGATVTNKLEKKITIPVTVEFKAQSIQNDMEDAVVQLQLQWKHEGGNWVDYNKPDDPYKGQLTLNDFRSETMTLSGSSEPVDKYDDEGFEIEYRWVQTSIEVNGGTSGALTKTDQKAVTIRKEDKTEVGPGVDPEKTTLHFDVKYGVYGENNDNTKITNTLVGNTQIEVKKTWKYTVKDADGEETTYTYPGNWNGQKIKDINLPDGTKWPAEIELSYPLLQNGNPYVENGQEVVLTMGKGETTATKGGLPRYDENGNEYTYTLNEQEPEGWFNIHSDYIKSVQDDMVVAGDRVTQISSAHENILGPGTPLIFEVSKEWKDDTDIDTRHPVTVGVFNIETGKQMATATLTMENNWYKKILIDTSDAADTVDNYVVKELRVGDEGRAVNVQYKDTYDGNNESDLAALKSKAEAFNNLFLNEASKNAVHARDALEKDPFAENQNNPENLSRYIVGTLGMDDTDAAGNLDFYYNVYLRTQKIEPNRAKYAIYNQRQGKIIYDLEKTWINDKQRSEAHFVIERKGEGDEWTTVKSFTLETESSQETENNASITVETGKTIAKIEDIELPKYDALGRVFEYRLREDSMSIWDNAGNKLTQVIEKNIADFSKSQSNADKYTCTVTLDHVDYMHSQWLNGKLETSPHHSDDTYLWKGENARKDSYDISLYKVWRDGGLPVNELNAYNAQRPDICFHLYRVSHNDLRTIPGNMGLTSEGNSAQPYVNWLKEKITSEADIKDYNGKIERVNEDYFWTTSVAMGSETTKVNNWLWKCDVSKEMPRYDENGSPYIYFVFEEMRGNSDNYVASYCNATVDSLTENNQMPNGTAITTEDTFSVTEGLDNGFLLINDGGTVPDQTTSSIPSGQNDENNHNDSQAEVTEQSRGYGDYFARIVVNTRQKMADVSGQKKWDLSAVNQYVGGDKGIPYESMPDVHLRLYRDKASVDKDHGGTYVAASFDKAKKIDELTTTGENEFKFAFPSTGENGYPAHSEETEKVNDTIDGKLPRYDKFGYRYSYWITEEPLEHFSSDNMGTKDQDNGTWITKPTPTAGEFNLTNVYTVAPPNVEISLTKIWSWPTLDNVEAAKKNITVTFRLHAVMAVYDENKELVPIMSGEKIAFDEVFDSKTITVTNGQPDKAGITFTMATSGSFKGKALPYYAPNGCPYLYYVEEVQPNGYTVTYQMESGAKIVTVPETTGILNRVKSAAKSFFSLFSNETSETEAVAGNKTALFVPTLQEPTADGEDQKAVASVTFNNTYDGGKPESYTLSIRKNWNKWNSPYDGLDVPDDKSIQVKLYRQWDIGNGEYGWEQVTEPDVTPATGAWDLAVDGTFTLTNSDNKQWKIDALGGLYKVAPNGKNYEYFVVEQQGEGMNSANNGGFYGYYPSLSPDKHPNVNSVSDENQDNNADTSSGDSTGENNPDTDASGTDTGTTVQRDFNVVSTDDMQQQLGYSYSVVLGSKDGETLISTQPVNDLLYKKVSYKKTWKKQINGTDTRELMEEELANLVATGALPENIYFVVQYKQGDSDWHYLTKEENVFTDNSTADQELSTHNIENVFVSETYLPANYSEMNGNWEHLPAYIWSGENKTEINYRVVEVMQFAGEKGTTPTLKVCVPDASATSVTTDISSSGNIIKTKSAAPLVEETECDFTNTVKVKPLVVRKEWVNDNANRDDTRPESITITIKKKDAAEDDDDEGLKVQLNEESKHDSGGTIYESKEYYVLASQFTDPADSADSIISELTATEKPVGNYTSALIGPTKETVDGKDIYVFTAKNTLQNNDRKTINLEAKKTWDREKDVIWKESLRPAKVTFTLQYRYKSKGAEDYKIDWTEATEEIAGGKNPIQTIWDDTEQTPVNLTEVSWEDVWKYFTEDHTAVPLEMEYRVIEEMCDADGNTISEVLPYEKQDETIFTTNPKDPTEWITEVTNTLNTVQVSAVKQWMWKNGDQTGTLTMDQIEKLKEKHIIPDYIRFELYYKTNDEDEWSKLEEFGYEDIAVADLMNADGTPKEYTSQKNLPMYDKNGNEIMYRLVETGICYGGTATTEEDQITLVSWQGNQEYISGRVGDFDVGITNESSVKTTVTNTLSAKISIPVSKVWIDANNQDNIRPDSVTIRLLADGADTGQKLVFSDEKGWSGTFDNLDKYKEGNLINYTIREDAVADYNTPEITGTASSGFTVTNTHTPETITISGTKTWVDDNDKAGARPDSITLRIHGFVDGKEINLSDELSVITVTEENNWTWSVEKLPKLDQGKEITYTVTEDWVKDYQTQINGYNITNTYVPPLPTMVNFSVIKKWNDEDNKDGLRPAQVFIRLYADGADTGKILTLSEANHWAGSFTSLDEYKDGKKIHYTIKEDPSEGYTPEISGSAAAGFVVTNTHTSGTVDVSGKKVWKDNGNKAGKRPDSVTLRVHIFADGQEVETREVKVTAKDGWKWSLGELPEYKDGKKMTYTVTEDRVKGYQSRIDGFDVYNTYPTATTPAELSIPVLKSWDDGNNRDRIRPASVIIRLYADGKYTGKMLTLSEQNGWKGSFKGLKESKDGKKIVYSIKEDEIRWYTATISGSGSSGFVVSNYHKLGDLPPDEGLWWTDPSGKNPNGPNGSGNGRYPGTGDNSKMLPWMALMVSSAGALTIVWKRRRRKKTR